MTDIICLLHMVSIHDSEDKTQSHLKKVTSTHLLEDQELILSQNTKLYDLTNLEDQDPHHLLESMVSQDKCQATTLRSQ